MGFPTRRRCANCGCSLEDIPTWFIIKENEAIEGNFCSWKCVSDFAADKYRQQAHMV